MSQFYARYVPPAIVAARAVENDDRNDLKRKNSSKASPKPKKRKIGSDVDGAAHVKKKSNNHVILDISQAPTDEKKLGIEKDTKNGFHDEGKLQDVLKDSQHVKARDGNETTPTKHARILEKFGKRKEQETELPGTDSEPTKASPKQYVHADRARLVNNLEPIPQPEVKLPERPLPSYSTVPEWMRTPVRIKSTIRLKLQELDLGNEILQSLADDGKREALSVQTAVLPMLLGKNVEERPDLCVAAATGSGKTLAYVLPILKTLQGRHNIKLRAVIVVPTRALVKQVVQTLRTLTNRLNLRIGTAEGSQSLVEEQRHLVEAKMIYDPAEYQRQQEAPIDWENFDPVILLEEASRSDPLANIGHIKAFFSKVDVLVCTPGRLVEHLQSTPGFNLDCVEWFVVDEADRLLNESYHEWLDTVLPALKSQTASARRDEVLRKMHMSVPERRVTKMLFSATMTSDLSQLMALQLSNPKLVLVEDQSSTSDTIGIEGHASSGNAEYQMPSGLIESAVALKDSENKPLYLVELINGHVRHQGKEPEKMSRLNAVTASEAWRKEPHAEDDRSSEESDTDSDSSSSSSLPVDSDDESAEDSVSSTTSSSDSSSETSTTSSSSSVPDSKAALSKELRLASASTKEDTIPRVLIFTKSTESAHRLARLLSILAPHLAPHIETFTRASSGPSDSTANLKKTLNKTRTRILQSFTTGRTRILISTDLAGRGLDIPGLEHVINYDIPASALTYVHRVGRTARAGNIGHAWTLVEHKQGKWFWETIGGKVKRGESSIGRGGRQIQKVTIALDMDKWVEPYEEALQQLGKDVKGQQP